MFIPDILKFVRLAAKSEYLGSQIFAGHGTWGGIFEFTNSKIILKSASDVSAAR